MEREALTKEELVAEIVDAIGDYSVWDKKTGRRVLAFIESQAAQIASLEKDAARYRWLVENCRSEPEEYPFEPYLIDVRAYTDDWRQKIHDAIDAALERKL